MALYPAKWAAGRHPSRALPPARAAQPRRAGAARAHDAAVTSLECSTFRHAIATRAGPSALMRRRAVAGLGRPSPSINASWPLRGAALRCKQHREQAALISGAHVLTKRA